LALAQVFGLGLEGQVLGLGLGLGCQVFGLGLGLESQVLGLGLGLGLACYGLDSKSACLPTWILHAAKFLTVLLTL